MGTLLLWLVTLTSITGIVMSMLLLIRNQPPQRRRVSFKNFLVLLLVYATVITGFGCLYLSLHFKGFPVLVEGAGRLEGPLVHLVEDVMYFSAVTLLTVGYGDITPQGIGRWIAMMQALIGYLLPAAFVVTTVVYNENRPKRL
ncbi:potassium channel family protein [Alteribacter natronophilus]|uniref:potassium channel family protein n=1 Tax=Alteribacter natronophilus TaxID=2583810 RepID=UPI00110E066F|nr:potassium channel family protein [Alteribacter natronophilus]TMW70559.1 two pore domain potassium channel family protein [Alteribacter natronophilus]